MERNMAEQEKHLDPRLQIAQMVYDIRGMLLDIEMKIADIPHAEESAEDYSAVFTEATEGDYIAPLTPTHACPEGFGEDAYWDCIYQCWMQPNDIEDDEYNLSTNISTDACYDTIAGEWTESTEGDWSNCWEETMAWEGDEEETMTTAPEMTHEDSDTEVVPTTEPTKEEE